MHTALSPEFAHTEIGQQAKALIAKCVHCGFCNATCPTYQLLGDELDGPRGRIYLMKEMFEGKPVSRITQEHLDRCLTCRACETTCPSGVEYGQLIDLGRRVINEKIKRPASEQLKRTALIEFISRPTLFKQVYRSAQSAKPFLPKSVQAKVQSSTPKPYSPKKHDRKMLVLQGCVQPALAPQTNIAATRVLDHLGIELITAPEAGCCGAIRQHNGELERAQQQAKQNIDAWWPYIEQGAEKIIMTASGCGAQVQDYDKLLAEDPLYADKAKTISELCCDLSVVVYESVLASEVPNSPQAMRVAVQEPCSYQHALRHKAPLQHLLRQLGYEVTPVAENHLCCGSAGTYSVFQPKLSAQLRERKLQHLMAHQPAVIVTANIGCQHHLQETSPIPVLHWIELVDRLFSPAPAA